MAYTRPSRTSVGWPGLSQRRRCRNSSSVSRRCCETSHVLTRDSQRSPRRMRPAPEIRGARPRQSASHCSGVADSTPSTYRMASPSSSAASHVRRTSASSAGRSSLSVSAREASHGSTPSITVSTWPNGSPAAGSAASLTRSGTRSKAAASTYARTTTQSSPDASVAGSCPTRESQKVRRKSLLPHAVSSTASGYSRRVTPVRSGWRVLSPDSPSWSRPPTAKAEPLASSRSTRARRPPGARVSEASRKIR